MDKIRGSAHRTVEIPGYHLHPQYDLKHTRHLIHERRHKKRGFSLNLAPMVDMFSILVIYLIMNFSTTGEAFFIAQQIKIPQATKGVPMESFPLVSVVGERVIFDAPSDGRAESYSVSEPNDGVNRGLREKLGQIRRLEEQIRGKSGFRGQVNIQADEAMDVDRVKQVMRVLIEEGWTTINLIIEPNAKLTP